MKFLILLAACIAISEACSCVQFDSRKDLFCASDYVSRVKVISLKNPNTSPEGILDVTYTVEHICIYRSTVKHLSNKITTPSQNPACGVELAIGKEYLLGGSIDKNGVVRAHLCGIVEEWSTVEDKNALKTYKC
ncbi:tissue inhibitor of metalloproteinase [Oesophagostomum dentatum]|uniref:Tissue inhibitor of metalloproteinase n=1 Tax=Oesophagostomum dentatum TaxID=61180 RepID=A0A0B1SJX1_OESDE|nr:tissue inhibitor of metalloproteinase [Oesophagostomum dentatum]